MTNITCEQMDTFDLEKFYLKQLVNNVPEYLFWKDKNSVFLGCNKNFSVMAGLSDPSEIIGKTDYDLPWSKEESDAYRADDLAVMRAGQGKYNIEESQTTRAGEQFTLLTNKIPLYDQKGDISGIIGIYTDITKLKNTQIKLEEEKIRAESANRAKTEFLANMSHDIKTPITGVISVADLMMHLPAWCTPEKAKILHASGQQILNFFNSCLELSKLEMSEFSSTEEIFSLKILCEEIDALFLPHAQSKNLKFNLDYDATLPMTLLGHRSSVYRVILNLVGNALKFTEKGEVQLRAFLAESLDEENIRVGIEVKDTGIGIPRDKHEIIFEKLRRLTPSYEGKEEGSGIGLYIVDQYVKRMKGNIIVESIVGQGSTFTVFLPMRISSESFASENKKGQVLSFDIHAQGSLPKVPTSAPLLLLVEDNPIVQLATSALLSDAGFQIEVAASGEEAVAMFSPGKYDLIYMDIGLPNMNGYEATQAIRAKEHAQNAEKKTPILALTSHGMMDVQVFCSGAGMQGVLSKPLTREQAENIWRHYGKDESIDITGLMLINN